MKFRSWPYRLAEEVINSKLPIRKEIEEIIRAINFEDVVKVSESKSKSKSGKIPVRGALNEFFKNEFLKRGWEGHHGVRVFDEKEGPKTKVDFLKDRVAVEVAFVHADFLGNDFLKFQMMSYSLLDKIDVGVYIVITKELFKSTITLISKVASILAKLKNISLHTKARFKFQFLLSV